METNIQSFSRQQSSHKLFPTINKHPATENISKLYLKKRIDED
jgi:hypothetical protein